MRKQSLVDGRYELEDEPLGAGGMAEVWAARDLRLDRTVAVKVVRFPGGVPDEELIRRFERESRITARLVHPGVPAVHDAGKLADGRRYLVMELVEGRTFGELVEVHGRLPQRWVANAAGQVCAVLTAAHEHSLIHRDISARNLMLAEDSSVKVLDFGLAAGLAPGAFSRITRTLQAFGTVAYAAPELAYGTATPQSDLYALGCVMYQLLTGEHVFSGPTEYAIVRQHEEKPPRPPSELNPDIHREMEELILHLLEKRPEDRPQTAEGVYRRLLPLAEVSPLDRFVGPFAMYTRLVGHAGLPIPGERVVSLAPGTLTRPPMGHGDVTAARERAQKLSGEGRYNQAAEVLSAALDPALLTFGEDDPEIRGLRQELADALFNAGDYRRAVAVYRTLVSDLVDAFGPDDPRVLEAREQEASCHAELGDIEAALRAFRAVVQEQQRLLPPGHWRTIESWAQIAGLLFARGETDQARRELTAARDRLPADHPGVEALQRILDQTA